MGTDSHPTTLQTDNLPPTTAPQRHGWRSWLLGLVLLLALVLVVTNLGEIEHFAQLARSARPAWLLAAALAQVLTYVCAAAVWQQTLRAAGIHYGLGRLVPLGFAKLFSDQALPSGGVSGITFLVSALNRRGVPTSVCTTTVVVNLISYYIAFALAALATVALLWLHHAIKAWIVLVVVVFSVVAVAVPAGALWVQNLGHKKPPALLLRVPGLRDMLQTSGEATINVLRQPSLLLVTSLWQAAIFGLDSLTLWIMLQAIGQNVSWLAVFPTFIVAAMVATIGLVPLGLGTFEATCVGLLSSLGVAVEAALAGTLLLRGFTLWLPMLPGLWFMRRELRGGS